MRHRFLALGQWLIRLAYPRCKVVLVCENEAALLVIPNMALVVRGRITNPSGIHSQIYANAVQIILQDKTGLAMSLRQAVQMACLEGKQPELWPAILAGFTAAQDKIDLDIERHSTILTEANLCPTPSPEPSRPSRWRVRDD